MLPLNAQGLLEVLVRHQAILILIQGLTFAIANEVSRGAGLENEVHELGPGVVQAQLVVEDSCKDRRGDGG